MLTIYRRRREEQWTRDREYHGTAQDARRIRALRAQGWDVDVRDPETMTEDPTE